MPAAIDSFLDALPYAPSCLVERSSSGHVYTTGANARQTLIDSVALEKILSDNFGIHFDRVRAYPASRTEGDHVKTILVTGSSGLIGSEVSGYFHARGYCVHGLDNNQRAVFFGPNGDTRWNQRRLESSLSDFHHNELDIRDRHRVLELLSTLRPAAIIHCAAQPSHDLAACHPVRRLRHQCCRDAELAGSGQAVLPRGSLRLPVDEQGLRRRSEQDPR